MQLYNITDEQFDTWFDSKPSRGELEEAFVMIKAKRDCLWQEGHDDSYYRDRYDRDARYAERIRRIMHALHAELIVNANRTCC
jgi:hypothetical protein